MEFRVTPNAQIFGLAFDNLFAVGQFGFHKPDLLSVPLRRPAKKGFHNPILALLPGLVQSLAKRPCRLLFNVYDNRAVTKSSAAGCCLHNSGGRRYGLLPEAGGATESEERLLTFVHIICDYAPGDMAWAEVTAALTAVLPESARMHLTAVGSFETIAQGFVIAQLGLAEERLRPGRTIIFANCAPRKDRQAARRNNEGEGLLFGTLKNGVPVIAVNSGFSLSFVRDDLVELWSVDVRDDGSQFRSRDYFPEIVGRAVSGDVSFRRQRLEPFSVIPEPPSQVIGYVDSFGNLKTTIRAGDPGVSALESGARIRAVIGNITRTATVATGSFNVMEGDLAFAPGSSGHSRRFWEFFQRGGSAWADFGRPPVGAKIAIETI